MPQPPSVGRQPNQLGPVVEVDNAEGGQDAADVSCDLRGHGWVVRVREKWGGPLVSWPALHRPAALPPAHDLAVGHHNRGVGSEGTEARGWRWWVVNASVEQPGELGPVIVQRLAFIGHRLVARTV